MKRRDEVTPSSGPDAARAGAPATTNHQPPYLAVGLVCAVTLVLRLFYLWQIRTVPYMWHLVGDAAGYHAWAQELAAGAWLGDKPFYQAPLYPYILAVWFRLAGSSEWGVRILQVCWSALAVGFLGIAVARCSGRVAGTVAAFMLALYAPAIFFDGIVQKASLGCLIVCSLLFLLSCDRTRRRLLISCLLGLSAGLLVLVRENTLLWIPLLAT